MTAERPPSSPSTGASVVVIGAGIVGAACAHRLQTLGFDVVLVDRGTPGEGCSFGNAGRIATSLVTPKSVPGLLRKVPGMLLDRRHPLKTSAGFVLRNLAWCTRFARAGTRDEVARITDALHVLLSRGDAAIDRLAAAAGATDVIGTDGVLYVYQDPALAEAARDEMAESDRRGTPVRYVTGDEVRDIDPAIPRIGDLRVPQTRGTVRAQPARAHHEGRRSLHRGRRRSRARRGHPARGAGGAFPARALPQRDLRGGQGRHRGRRLVAPARVAARRPPPGRSRARLPRDAAARRCRPEDRDPLWRPADLDDADDRWTPGIERRGARGRGCGAELEAPRRNHRRRKDPLSAPRRRRSDPMDGSPPLDPGLPAGHRRAPGAPPTSCSPPGTAPWGSPSRASRRRSSGIWRREGSPTSTSHPTGRIASDVAALEAVRVCSRRRGASRGTGPHSRSGRPVRASSSAPRTRPRGAASGVEIRVAASRPALPSGTSSHRSHAPIANISSRSCLE